MEPDNDPFFAPFDHRLCFELALAIEEPAEILERYNVSQEQFAKLKKVPAFMSQIIEYRKEIKDKGLSFRAKSQLIAEELLKVVYDLAHHPATPPNVKLDCAKFAMKAADLEPKETKGDNMYLPQIAAAIQGLSDGELELRVTQLVSRRAPIQTPAIDVTPTQH